MPLAAISGPVLVAFLRRGRCSTAKGDQARYRAPARPVQALEQVWPSLDLLHPMAKKLLVEAVTIAASHDGRVSVAEAELLRTICAILHCPLPPLLGAAYGQADRIRH